VRVREAKALGVALQKDLMPKDPLILGIISLIAGSTLQKDTVDECDHLIAKGNEILSTNNTLAAPRVRLEGSG